MVDTEQPLLGALDLGVTRGDGVFETISIGGGRAQATEPHLGRLARSAAMLELPEPDLDAWRRVVYALAEMLRACRRRSRSSSTRAASRAGPADRLGLRGGLARPHRSAARRHPRHLLDRGYAHDVASTAPWLLQGAKTLSYAVNRAAVREAHRRGADDVLFLSSDGYLLEGPTANLLLKRGDRLTTPSTSLGILAGTTQADAFSFARSRGLTTSYELLTRDALEDADALWLVSSVRHAAPIRAVDGVPRADRRRVHRGR